MFGGSGGAVCAQASRKSVGRQCLVMTAAYLSAQGLFLDPGPGGSGASGVHHLHLSSCLTEAWKWWDCRLKPWRGC